MNINNNPMEFKYRSIDDQASSHPPPIATSTFFTEQALRAGYNRSHEIFQSPMNMREAIKREIEKERIREEIIAEERARRRVLEAEVRREMRLEREMGLNLRRGDGMSFLSRPMSFGQCEATSGLSFEERIGLSLQERLGKAALPFQGSGEPKISEIKTNSDVAKDKVILLRNAEPRISEEKSTSEVSKENVIVLRNGEPRISEVKSTSEVSKENVIVLAKPDATLSRGKRKVVTSPTVGTSERSSIGSNKKIKEEWSCAICQVTATSERALNDHLQGKKHKAKEAALITQRTGKNFGLGLFPKKTTKTIMVEATTNSTSSDQGKKKELVQVRKKCESSIQKVSKPGNSKKNEGLFLQLNGDKDDTKKRGRQKVQKDKFKFWCEMCQVGAFTEKVMNNHKKGKKHRSGLLQEIVHIGGAELLQQIVQNGGAIVEPAQETKDGGEVSVEDAPKSGDGANNQEAAVLHQLTNDAPSS